VIPDGQHFQPVIHPIAAKENPRRDWLAEVSRTTVSISAAMHPRAMQRWSVDSTGASPATRAKGRYFRSIDLFDGRNLAATSSIARGQHAGRAVATCNCKSGKLQRWYRSLLETASPTSAKKDQPHCLFGAL
jgi:hypothetical protein